MRDFDRVMVPPHFRPCIAPCAVYTLSKDASAMQARSYAYPIACLRPHDRCSDANLDVVRSRVGMHRAVHLSRRAFQHHLRCSRPKGISTDVSAPPNIGLCHLEVTRGVLRLGGADLIPFLQVCLSPSGECISALTELCLKAQQMQVLLI